MRYLLALLLVAVLAGCGGDTTANEVSNAVGGECEDSGWYTTNSFTDEKMTIWDCMIDGERKCVSYKSGVARDETEWAKLEFEDTLSDDHPGCI